MSAVNPERILVRGPNWVGDVVMATPMLRAIRAHFPDAHIALLLKGHLLPLLDGAEFVDELLAIEPSDGSGLFRSRRLGRRLKPMGFDLALLLTNSLSSALEVFWAGIPHRAGFAGDGRRLLLTQVLPRRRGLFRKPRPRPMVDSYLEIAAAVGARSVGRNYTLPVTQEDDLAAAKWFGDADLETGSGVVVGLNPGAHFGSSKTWVPSRFAAVADKLHEEKQASIYLLGGPGEEALLNEISQQLKVPHFSSAESIVPLGILAAVLRRMDLLITNDTGPRSLAQAVQTPTVVLAGPMDTGWTDANLELSRVLRKDVDCGPCDRAVCRTDHRCMTQIDVVEVVAASIELLNI